MNENTIVKEYSCPMWINFLNDVTESNTAAINRLQEFAGSCLAPESSWGKALVLLGEGVGKTTFSKILREIVGHENTSSISLTEFKNEFSRYGLKDKWLNICPLEHCEEIDTAYFKGIVTAEPMTASKRNVDTIMFTPSCKLVFETNSYMEEGRRHLCIHFDYKPAASIPNIFSILMEEIDSIRAWAEEGRQRLNAQECFTANTKKSPMTQTTASMSNNTLKKYHVQMIQQHLPSSINTLIYANSERTAITSALKDTKVIQMLRGRIPSSIIVEKMEGFDVTIPQRQGGL